MTITSGVDTTTLPRSRVFGNEPKIVSFASRRLCATQLRQTPYLPAFTRSELHSSQRVAQEPGGGEGGPEIVRIGHVQWPMMTQKTSGCIRLKPLHVSIGEVHGRPPVLPLVPTLPCGNGKGITLLGR